MKIGRVAVVVAAGVLVAIMFSCGQSDTEMNLDTESETKVALNSVPDTVIPIPSEVAVDSPVLENRKEERTEEFLAINLQLPVLSGTRADSEINDLIERDRLEKISQVEEWAGFLKENSSDSSEFTLPGKSELVSVWDYTEQDNIVSIIIEWDQYAGGAHDDFYNVIYTFDKENGTIYSFTDLFTSNAGVSYVTDFIKNEIKNNPDDYMEYSIEDLEAYQGDYDYYINGNTINVVFAPYDLQCFAAGVTMYSFDAVQLERWLKPEIYSAIMNKVPKKINSSVIYNEDK